MRTTFPSGLLSLVSKLGPRRFRVLTPLGFLVLALCIYAPALGNGKFVFGTDTYGHDYLMHLYGWKNSIGHGELPLWCPYLFCGFPFLASAALCPFYPSQWLYALLPFNTSFTLQYVLAVAVAGIGFVWWMRQLRMPQWIAVWGGLAFVLSGHFLTLTYAGHLQKMIAIAWAPIALGAVAGMVRQAGKPRRNPQFVKSAVMLCVSWAMQLLASHPQIFYATFVACLLYVAGDAVLRLRGNSSAAEPPPKLGVILRPTWWSLGAFAGAAMLTALLSAVQLFPSAEMRWVSNRAAGVSYAEAVETSYPPKELLEYFIPSVKGDTVRGTRVPYTGKWGERIVSDFTGAGILFLAVTGVVTSQRRFRWWLAGALCASIVVGLGKYTPVYMLLYKLMPGFKAFRSPGTFMFIADLSLVALACFGIESLFDRLRFARRDGWLSAFRKTESSPSSPEQRGSLWLQSNVVTVTAAIALGVTLILALVGLNHVMGTKLDIATIEEKKRYLDYRALWLGGAEIGLVALLVLVARWIPKYSMAGLAVAAIALPLVHNRHFIQFDPLGPYLDYIQNQPTFAPLANARQPVRVLEENKLKSDQMLSGVATASGYHPVMLDSYVWLAQHVGIDSEMFTGTFCVNYGRTYAARAAAGGQWESAGKFRKAGRAEFLWHRLPEGGFFMPTRLIASPDGMAQERRALLAWQQHQRGSGDHTADVQDESAAGAASLDVAFMRSAELQRLRLSEGAQNARGWLMSWAPNRIEMRVASETSGGRSLLRMAELAAPGWRARTADGKPVPVTMVNGTQRGLAISGGEQVLRMQYAPYSFRLGLFCSLAMVTLAISAAFGTTARRVKRVQKSSRKLVGPPGLEPGTNRL